MRTKEEGPQESAPLSHSPTKFFRIIVSKSLQTKLLQGGMDLIFVDRPVLGRVSHGQIFVEGEPGEEESFLVHKTKSPLLARCSDAVHQDITFLV
jgi:hypothetical protein